MKILKTVSCFVLIALASACGDKQTENEPQAVSEPVAETIAIEQAKTPSRFDIYSKVRLSTDLSHLSDNQRKMISLLIA
ncbi:MAG: hypothetical protein ACI8PV_002007, partial [Dinoroseobacter sp.]